MRPRFLKHEFNWTRTNDVRSLNSLIRCVLYLPMWEDIILKPILIRFWLKSLPERFLLSSQGSDLTDKSSGYASLHGSKR